MHDGGPLSSEDVLASSFTPLTMARVRLDHVRKQYDNGFVAVHDASFEIHDGEFVVLVGPSGCGKSTTLRMIAGLETVTSGTLTIGDRVVNDVPPKDRDIAMVFQNYALYPHMTVFDNMAFGLKLRGYPKQEIRERVDRAAEILGIGGILDRKPRQLSGGQRQRVAVGRAIVRQPQVFLFDEPLSNLDAKLRVQMRAEISRLHRQLGTTMVYVTHDQVEAMTMGNRIVVMNGGHIQQIDEPMNIYHHPANKFVAEFIGSPSMNFIRGSVVAGEGISFISSDGDFALGLSNENADMLREWIGKDIIMGIRPEDMYVAESHAVPGVVSHATMTLDVVEPMGNEMFLYVRTGEHRLVARVAPQSLPQPDASIDLAFDLTRLHFFDPDTENNIAFETPGLMA